MVNGSYIQDRRICNGREAASALRSLQFLFNLQEDPCPKVSIMDMDRDGVLRFRDASKFVTPPAFVNAEVAMDNSLLEEREYISFSYQGRQLDV